MRDAILHIAGQFPAASAEPLAHHPLAAFIRGEWPTRVRRIMPSPFGPYGVHGGAGVGGWAQVPWLAILDPAVTGSASRGYCVSFLFSADMRRLYLSLIQATAEVHEGFGPDTIGELRRRVHLMRARLAYQGGRFNARPIHLASHAPLACAYEAAHALGRAYDIADLPADAEFAEDLAEMLPLYARLRARGGVRALDDPADEAAAEHAGSMAERRRYHHHRAIERDAAAAREAAKVHGHACQGCGFDFEAIYGPAGRGGIEAHHLTPPAELPEDAPVGLDPRHDFAVLCANCHRIMHRRNGPRTIAELRALGRVAEVETAMMRLRNAFL